MNVVTLPEDNGCHMAGARRPGELVDGWGMIGMSTMKPHFWTFEVLMGELFAETPCGLLRHHPEAEKALTFEAGNYPRCKRCIAALRRQQASEQKSGVEK